MNQAQQSKLTRRSSHQSELGRALVNRSRIQGLSLVRFCGMLSFGLMLLAGLCFLGGCKESSEVAGQKQAAAGVDEAGRLILASRQDIHLNEQEIDRAFSSPTANAQKALAGKVVDRLENQVDFSEFDEALAKADELNRQYQPGDDALLQGISSQLMRAANSLLSQYGQIMANSDAANQKRLTKALDTLNKSLRLAQASKNSQAEMGPRLMLGTLYLMAGRDGRGQLENHAHEVALRRMSLVNLLADIIAEQTVGVNLEKRLPGEAISLSETRLAGTEAELAQTRDRIATLSRQLNQVKSKLDDLSQKARQMDIQYLELQQQAEKAKGQERFELYEQAYAVRVGHDGRSGGIYYESQRDSVQNEFEIVQSQLEYEQLRSEQLVAIVANISDQIDEMRNSPVIEQVASAQQEHARRMEHLMSRLSAELKGLKEAESSYKDSRVQAVDNFTDAGGAFSRVAGSTRGKSRKHLELLEKMADNELKSLWLSDAAHYDAGALVISLVENVEGCGDLVVGLRDTYEKSAQEARDTAAEYDDAEADN